MPDGDRWTAVPAGLAPGVVAASEPYPGRWTHHVLVTEADQIDEELMGWLREAWDFAESKR